MHKGLTQFLERCDPAHLTAPRHFDAPAASTPFTPATPTGVPSRLRPDFDFESPVNQATSTDPRNIDPRNTDPRNTDSRNRDHHDARDMRNRDHHDIVGELGQNSNFSAPKLIILARQNAYQSYESFCSATKYTTYNFSAPKMIYFARQI